MIAAPTRLYHWTCADHGEPGIRRSRLIWPFPHVMLGLPPMVWLTSEPAQGRESLGLTSTYLSCDRMAYRVTVNVDDAFTIDHWPTSRARRLANPDVVRDLERFGRPDTWWISFESVPAGDILRMKVLR